MREKLSLPRKSLMELHGVDLQKSRRRLKTAKYFKTGYASKFRSLEAYMRDQAAQTMQADGGARRQRRNGDAPDEPPEPRPKSGSQPNA